MNANSQLKMPVISDWLRDSTIQLVGAGIGSAKLDAEIILAHTIRKSRTYLHAHGEELLSHRHLEIADARLQLRLDRTPIAYIIGHKEFYGRLFRVTPATLIPRPESETLITMLKELQASAIHTQVEKRLVDVGTGSGCLGITAKLELQEYQVTLIDISRHALKVAESNASYLNADVTIIQSDLMAQYPFVADVIVANLPYVDHAWERSPETNHEPEIALFASNQGLELINKLLAQSKSHLSAAGYLLLEADPRQHDSIVKEATKNGFSTQEIRGYIICLKRS